MLTSVATPETQKFLRAAPWGAGAAAVDVPADVDVSILRVDQLPDVLLVRLQQMLHVHLSVFKVEKDAVLEPLPLDCVFLRFADATSSRTLCSWSLEKATLSCVSTSFFSASSSSSW